MADASLAATEEPVAKGYSTTKPPEGAPAHYNAAQQAQGRVWAEYEARQNKPEPEAYAGQRAQEAQALDRQAAQVQAAVKPGASVTEIAHTVTRISNQHVEYRADSLHGAGLPGSVGDYAQSPGQTALRGAGDCEDQALYRAELMQRAGVPPSRIGVVTVTGPNETHVMATVRDDKGTTHVLNGSAPVPLSQYLSNPGSVDNTGGNTVVVGSYVPGTGFIPGSQPQTFTPAPAASSPAAAAPAQNVPTAAAKIEASVAIGTAQASAAAASATASVTSSAPAAKTDAPETPVAKTPPAAEAAAEVVAKSPPILVQGGGEMTRSLYAATGHEIPKTAAIVSETGVYRSLEKTSDPAPVMAPVQPQMQPQAMMMPVMAPTG